MKPNELRIENFVRYDGQIRQIKGIKNPQSHLYEPVWLIDLNYVYQKKVLVGINEIKPIKLTTEWLLKFGINPIAEKRTNNPAFNFLDFAIMIMDNNGFTTVQFSDFLVGSVKTRKIEYVHQLQNFCFEFSGEELFFQPKKIQEPEN